MLNISMNISLTISTKECYHFIYMANFMFSSITRVRFFINLNMYHNIVDKVTTTSSSCEYTKIELTHIIMQIPLGRIHNKCAKPYNIASAMRKFQSL